MSNGAEMLAALSALTFTGCFGFVIGRQSLWDRLKDAEERASKCEARVPTEENLAGCGMALYRVCQKVWFDLSVVGHGFVCTRTMNVKFTNKPDLEITIRGEVQP